MAAIALEESALHSLRSHLRSVFDDVSASHLAEAVAAGLGFKTHASLLAAVKAAKHTRAVVIDDLKFFGRLFELNPGLGNPADEDAIFFEHLARRGTVPAVRVTAPTTSKALHYKGPRAVAWRNLMVATINAGLAEGLFGIHPEENFWPGAAKTHGDTYARGGTTHAFHFMFDGDVPAVGTVRADSYDELSIHAALWPVAGRERFIATGNAHFYVGDVFGRCWFERRSGAFLQTSTHGLSCRKNRLARVAGAKVVAEGFGDRGPIKL